MPPFLRTLYKRLIEPRQQEENARNRELVLNVVLLGTIAVSFALLALLVVSFFLSNNHYVLARMGIGGVLLLFLCGIYYAIRRKGFKWGAHLLVVFYGLLAFLVVGQWGINTPFGVLLFAVVIILAGIVVRSSYALYATAAICLYIIAVQLSIKCGFYLPDESWSANTSSFGDALGYCAGFSLLAVISWLFGRQMERSLYRIQLAEAALLTEKKMLKVRIAERTAELQKAQFEEVQQLYNFAELGQLSTGFIHDMANYLTVLTMEIEGVHSRKHADAIERANAIIGYLDRMVDDVRGQLRGDIVDKPFTPSKKVQEIIGLLKQKAVAAGVDLQLESSGEKVQAMGDPARFSQVISILVGNAIDACKTSKSKAVLVTYELQGEEVVIRVSDTGPGIPASEREKLFKPFTSTKKTGMGIGLFIAKRVIETHFSGSLELDSATKKTTFVLRVPQYATPKT